MLGQRIGTLFRKPADWEDGGLVSQRNVLPGLELAYSYSKQGEGVVGHCKLLGVGILCSFLFWPRHAACRILVPRPGIEPVPPAVEAQSPNRWTAREAPGILCSCGCPCRSGHNVPVNFQQDICSSLFCNFLTLYEWKVLYL